MIAPMCRHDDRKKFGKNRNGSQRYRCNNCGTTFSDEFIPTGPLGNMRVDVSKACMALGLMLEGMSLRATSRMTGLDRNTLGDLLLTAGENCEAWFGSVVKNVAARDVQADEIWSFVGMKEKTRKRLGASEDFGDSWTWIAVERDSKLVLAYHVGQRGGNDCQQFLDKLDSAVSGRFQLSTDGLGAYRNAVPFTFRSRVDFGMIIKTFQSNQAETRYSPASIIGVEKDSVFGNPDMDKVCTSHVERLNLTLRMQMRRFTRLTNGFSKSLDHHMAMQSLFFCWYNFSRFHGTLKTEDGQKRTPAMACGLATKAYSIQEMLTAAATAVAA